MKNEHDFYQISLKVFLKNEKGEILILESLLDGTHAGYYDFPGGRIDQQEFLVPFSDIIARELKEEIGDVKYELNSRPVSLGRHLLGKKILKADDDVHVLYLFFEARYISGKIEVSQEHLGYKWLDIKKNETSKYFISGNLEGINLYLGK